MIRIGIDFGGTKIEAAALGADGRFLARVRTPNPGNYDAALHAVRDLVRDVEAEVGATGSIGVGAPGSISPRTGLVRNSNSIWVNDRPFHEDLERVLGRPIRIANDANCLALSEATDGAAAGAGVVFAAILGTGCGGGLVAHGRLLEGRNGIAGEWGHSPLPWLLPNESPALPCWCGRLGCLETYISGTGLSRDFQATTGERRSAADIVQAARREEPAAADTLDRYVDRLARGLAVIADILDPDVIVLGGGMSNVVELYQRLPAAITGHVFADVFDTPIVPAKHGDSSGVRGAAWLWPLE